MDARQNDPNVACVSADWSNIQKILVEVVTELPLAPKQTHTWRSVRFS